MNTTPKSTKVAETAAADKPEAAADAVAAEVAALRAEVKALVAQAGAVKTAAKGGAKRAARALAAEGAATGRHAAGDALAEWRAFDRKVVAETRDSPWRSLGVAGLIGLILGLVLRR